MTALMNSIVTTLAHEAQAVDAEIEVGPLPPIHCDRLALEQVFTNLLDNAIKYLRPGMLDAFASPDTATPSG